MLKENFIYLMHGEQGRHSLHLLHNLSNVEKANLKSLYFSLYKEPLLKFCSLTTQDMGVYYKIPFFIFYVQKKIERKKYLIHSESQPELISICC
jgi:hypothetical protein